MQKKSKTCIISLGNLEVWFKSWNLQVESYKEWQVTMLKVKWAVQTIGAQIEKRECSLRAKDARKGLGVTCACVPSCFTHVWLFVTLWTLAHQALLSMGISRQEYWSDPPCPPLGDLPDPGIEPTSPTSPASAGDSLPPVLCGKPLGVTQTNAFLLNSLFFSGSQTRLLISFSSLPTHLLPPCPVASLVLNLLYIVSRFYLMPCFLQSASMI